MYLIPNWIICSGAHISNKFGISTTGIKTRVISDPRYIIWYAQYTPPIIYHAVILKMHTHMIGAVTSRIIPRKPSRGQISLEESMKIVEMEVPVISHKT